MLLRQNRIIITSWAVRPSEFCFGQEELQLRGVQNILKLEMPTIKMGCEYNMRA